MSLAPQKIRQLPPAVAERIAAGEVIERPASVVKELVENSLDAGATEISVFLEDGGKQLIEVMDNGLGMGPEDLALCIARHATSKLSSLDDLERIQTLGFRGEALPSIAAVSELSILSRPVDSESAQELIAGTPGAARPKCRPTTFGHFLNSPHGTRIQARGLFSQVPARLKFLKAQGAEVSAVREWIERLALAHCNVGFRLISDGRSILNLRPSDEAFRVRAILSDGEDCPIATADSELDPKFATLRDPARLRVRAHWLQGLSTPQTRKIAQVVNGRAIRDRFLQQAMLAAFRQTLLPGQFPAVALFIDIDPSQLDVNVHPTKTEIRFLNNRNVFKTVEALLSSLIERHGAPAFASASWTPPTEAIATPVETSSHARPWVPATPVWTAKDQASFSLTRSVPLENPSEPYTAHPLSNGRYVGSLFNTYLVYELHEELALVDQHAAHERVRYEKLRKRMVARAQGTTPSSQALLIPEAVHFSTEERPSVERGLEALSTLGFEAELFGDNVLLFRSIPGEWGDDSLKVRLKSLVERLLAFESGEKALLLDEALFERLANEACHSAVRAGDRLQEGVAVHIVDELFRCEHPWNCPHGRPTVVRVPKGRLEEWFQRRV